MLKNKENFLLDAERGEVEGKERNKHNGERGI